MDLSLFRKSLSGPVGSRKASLGAAGLHIEWLACGGCV